MKKIYLLFGLGLVCNALLSQVYDDYIGAGHSDGIVVTTSDNYQLYQGAEYASGDKTLGGQGLVGKQMEASRFLSQASFGADMELINEVADLGIENWIDQQLNTPPTYYTDTLDSIYHKSLGIYVANGGDSADYPIRPNHVHMDYAWWQNNMLAKDLLRQRLAYSLSQICVISLEGGLSGYSAGVANYYDIMVRNAFGNYKDLLLEVSLHPAMGNYLSHMNNPKTDTVNNIFPDENYAREIMQLFSIGLYQLNLDGSYQLDANNNPIPTYTNADIKEFAKVFTGLGVGARLDTNNTYFGLGIYIADLTVPMQMYEEWHEQGPKYLLDGYVIPDGQTGMQDIEDAVEHLFNHPNVGPFLAKRLIQRLVKSNPTPSYIAAVAGAFNDNGAGVRGDMQAVIKAILLHPEARSCAWSTDPDQGKLREPILKYTDFVKFTDVLSPLGNYWNYSYWYKENTAQHPLRSQTVFNFYGPDYTPSGMISNNGLVAPEFELYNTRTSVGFANQVYYWVESEIMLRTAHYEDYTIARTNLSPLMEVAKSSDAIIDHLDVVLTHGQLSDRTRAIIKETLDQNSISLTELSYRVRLATYLILISPDYNILK
ncbi:MAG: DUF1800 domain-containing protein [Flavobacteriales bacterium]|jgi:uncharacterized protein (DUF1800 family)|nr:DUF1800 domain-containing protein [Flavobacteriales bacterium]